MRITHLEASNWRNFKNVAFDIDDRLFIVGPNASGKSNLLDVFRFLGDIARPGGGLAPALSERGGLSKVRSLFTRYNAKGRLIVDVTLQEAETTWRYRLAIRGEAGGRNRPIVDEELVEKNGEVLLRRPDGNDREDRERLTQTHLEQISANRDFRPIADHLARAQYFHLVPQIIRDPRRVIDSPHDQYGDSFIAQMNATPSKIRNAWLRRMQEALAAAVPVFFSKQKMRVHSKLTGG